MSQPSDYQHTGQIPRLVRLLDVLTSISYGLSGLLLLAITAAYLAEIVLRFFFNAPTVWSIDMISYMLGAMVSLAIPELTRTSKHVNISIVPDSLSPVRKAKYIRFLSFMSLLIISVVIYITATETYKLFVRGNLTVGTFVVPKWWVSIFIPVGLFLGALQYLRLTIYGAGSVQQAPEEGE